MAIPTQSNHRLRSQERFEQPVQLTRRIEQLGIVACQNDLQGFGIAEEDDGRYFRAEGCCEGIAIAMAAAPHKRNWHRDPMEHLPDLRRFWPIGERHKRFLL